MLVHLYYGILLGSKSIQPHKRILSPQICEHCLKLLVIFWAKCNYIGMKNRWVLAKGEEWSVVIINTGEGEEWSVDMINTGALEIMELFSITHCSVPTHGLYTSISSANQLLLEEWHLTAVGTNSIQILVSN